MARTARPRHEPLTLLAAVAARTRRVRLGTGVLLPALRNPVVLGHVVGTLDRVAEGRVILGVGIAADTPAIRKEFAAAGVPWDRRVGRFLETLEICRALWRQDGVSFSGKHFTLQDVTMEPKPHRPGGRQAGLLHCSPDVDLPRTVKSELQTFDFHGIVDPWSSDLDGSRRSAPR